MPNFVINYTSAQVEGKNIDDMAIVNDCKNDIDKTTRIGNFSHEREYSLFKHFKTEGPDFKMDRKDIDNPVERRKIFFRSNDNKSGSLMVPKPSFFSIIISAILSS